MVTNGYIHYEAHTEFTAMKKQAVVLQQTFWFTYQILNLNMNDMDILVCEKVIESWSSV
jgi:hypothetical protein